MAEEPSPSDQPFTTAYPGLGTVASALWAQAESHRLAADLRLARIPALVLKGPDLQVRLYGTPAAYPSGDVDILVPASHAAAARSLLSANGWEFEPENGVLWRLSRAATYRRDGFRVDLHWGLHAAHLPGVTLRGLERELWRGARWGSSGYLEPRLAPLLVFLAVHAVGHNFERPHWVENVHAAAALVTDWSEVWLIADRAHVRTALEASLARHPDDDRSPVPGVLDGLTGKLISAGTWFVRGHFVPHQVRDRVRDFRGRGKRGGRLDAHVRTVTFAGVRLEVDPGVFEPQPVTEGIVARALDVLRDVPSPNVVEVGTGCGAVSLAVAVHIGGCQAWATDISAPAIACAERNRRRLGVGGVHFVLGSLLDPVPHELRGYVDAICANVPYVAPAQATKVDWAVPTVAVEGPDADGLGHLRTVAARGREWLRPGGWLLFQCADWQWDSWAIELGSLGYGVVPPSERRPSRAVVASARWERPA